MTIAGHDFEDKPGGRMCDCGMTWLYVVSQREFWKPGEPLIAHSGCLTQNEVDELNRELDRIWAATKAAIES